MAAPSQYPRWWVTRRSASSIAWFRCVAAAAIGAECAMHWQAADFLIDSGLFDLAIAAGGVRWLSALGSGSLRVAFGVCLAASLLLGLGLVPRLGAAVLFVVLGATNWVLRPIAEFRDGLMSLTALTFMLMAPAPPLLSTRIRRGAEDVDCLVVVTLLLFLSLMYATNTVGAWLTHEGPNARLSSTLFSMIPVLYVLPNTALLELAVLVQVGAHAFSFYSTGIIAENLLLAGTSLLFTGNRAGRTRSLRFGTGDAVGVIFACCACAALAGALFGMREIPALRFLSDAGLVWRPKPADAQGQGWRLATASWQRRHSWTRLVDAASGRRQRALMALLGDAQTGPALLVGLANALAMRECAGGSVDGKRGQVVLSTAVEVRAVFEFACGENRPATDVTVRGTESPR